jgi:lipopolysaccharide export system protein LptA
VFCRRSVSAFCLIPLVPALLLTGSPVSARPPGADSASAADSAVPFTIQHADRFLQHRDSSGAQTYTLQGAVDVLQGESRILCHILTYYPAASSLTCLDSVRVTDPERELSSDTLYYYMDRQYYRAVGRLRWTTSGFSGSGQSGDYFREKGILRIEGQAEAEDSLRRIKADVLEYDYSTRCLRATGRVSLLDHKTGSFAEAAGGILDRDRDRVTLTGRPELTFFEAEDSVRKNPYRLVCDLLTRFGRDSVSAVGRVRLWHDSLSVTSDSLFENQASGMSYFRGGPPVVDGPSYKLRGEKVDVLMSGRRLRQVTAVNAARGEFYADSAARAAGPVAEGRLTAPGSWIVGDTLSLAFRTAGLDSIVAVGNARSYFRENAAASVNYLTGGRIVLLWNEGAIERVKVAGGGRGLFLLPDTTSQKPASSRSAAADSSGRHPPAP